jgi:glycosyltransferase involved in cell wall biosynthesis
MLNRPLITAYILNYNYHEYLQQCIDSVIGQTYDNIEIIIIDDGSTDDSFKVLDLYKGGNSIQVIYQKNIGLIESIIKVFSIAKGKYVVRIDADDWVSPDFIKELTKEIEKDADVAMVFPDYYEVDESGKILHHVKRRNFSSEVTLLDQPAHGACTLIKKSAYLSVGGHNEKLKCQDGVDIWLSITEKFAVRSCNKPLFYYRKHRRSLTTNYFKILENRAIIYRDHAIKRGYKNKKIIGFISVREESLNCQEFSLLTVGGGCLLDWVINKAIRSATISEVVISTDSLKVKEYVELYKSNNQDKAISIHTRPAELVTSGVHINESIKNYFNSMNIKANCMVVILTPNYPFSGELYIDTAVYASYIFNTKIVDSVIESNSIYYFHDGHGLVEASKGSIRHERDNIYIRKGGITVYTKAYIENLVNSLNEDSSIITGHVVIDEYSSFEVKNLNDIKVADFIASEILKENL